MSRYLEKGARLVVSDSGGVPKEAFFFRVPSVILRRKALWVELVELGWARTVWPITAENLFLAARSALDQAGGREGSPYGDGDSVRRIVEVLLEGRPGGPPWGNMDLA